ncbi:hypothetical protein AMJ44_13210, partial [candidate division WOR-1 bacterium DG_54_3]
MKKRQLLVQLDDTEYRAAVNQAKAQLSSAKASLEQAQLVYKRQKELFEKKLSSQEQYDMAKTDLDLAVARHEQAAATEVGEIVMIGTMNNPGTVIMAVSDMSEIETEVEVDETDIAGVKLGQEAKIEIDAYPDTVFKGKVTEIGHSARISGMGTQDQVTNFLVKVKLLDEVPSIRPGMSASVDITTDSRLDALNVPIQAVVMREQKGDTSTVKEEEKEGALASVDSVSKKGNKKDKKKKKEIE